MDLENKANELREAVEAGASTSDVLQILAEVQAAERERCAKLCEQYADDADQWRPLDGSRGAAVREVARRIRAPNVGSEAGPKAAPA